MTYTPHTEVEQAEDKYNAYARLAESAPHRWGMDEEAELARLAAAVKAAYAKHNVPASERMVGI